jgi:hypothetical protein
LTSSSGATRPTRASPGTADDQHAKRPPRALAHQDCSKGDQGQRNFRSVMARAIPGDAPDRQGLAFQTTPTARLLPKLPPRAPHPANKANQADNHQPKTSLPSGLVWQERHQMASLHPEWRGCERINPLRASARGHNFCEATGRARPPRQPKSGILPKNQLQGGDISAGERQRQLPSRKALNK